MMLRLQRMLLFPVAWSSLHQVEGTSNDCPDFGAFLNQTSELYRANYQDFDIDVRESKRGVVATVRCSNAKHHDNIKTAKYACKMVKRVNGDPVPDLHWEEKVPFDEECLCPENTQINDEENEVHVSDFTKRTSLEFSREARRKEKHPVCDCSTLQTDFDFGLATLETKFTEKHDHVVEALRPMVALAGNVAELQTYLKTKKVADAQKFKTIEEQMKDLERLSYQASRPSARYDYADKAAIANGAALQTCCSNVESDLKFEMAEMEARLYAQNVESRESIRKMESEITKLKSELIARDQIIADLTANFEKRFAALEERVDHTNFDLEMMEAMLVQE